MAFYARGPPRWPRRGGGRVAVRALLEDTPPIPKRKESTGLFGDFNKKASFLSLKLEKSKSRKVTKTNGVVTPGEGRNHRRHRARRARGVICIHRVEQLEEEQNYGPWLFLSLEARNPECQSVPPLPLGARLAGGASAHGDARPAMRVLLPLRLLAPLHGEHLLQLPYRATRGDRHPIALCASTATGRVVPE